jgi:hypothetical protein
VESNSAIQCAIRLRDLSGRWFIGACTYGGELSAFEAPGNQKLQDPVGTPLSKSTVHLFRSGTISVAADLEMQSLLQGSGCLLHSSDLLDQGLQDFFLIGYKLASTFHKMDRLFLNLFFEGLGL